MAVSITKPTVGGSLNSWGTELNTALDAIVTEINNNSGGTNQVTPNIGGTVVTATGAELNKLDGATVTTAEINVLDGDTSATSTTVAAADRVVFNDNGTMKQVAMSDIAAYVGGATGGGSVTSVGLSAPTGLTVSNSPITSSGNISLQLQSGYAIPTTSSQNQWNTAYSWGDHSNGGYITSVAAGTGISVSTSGSTVTVTSTTGAGAAAGSVGSYALLAEVTNTSNTYTPGSTASGSSLRFANTISDINETTWSGTASTSTIAAPLGSWRCMGNIGYYKNQYDQHLTDTSGGHREFARTTLWLRIS